MEKTRDNTEFISKVCEDNYVRIRNYLVSIIGHRTDADDIVQEVFLIAYQQSDKLEKHENIVAFLYKVARNLASEHFRDKKKRATAELTEFNAGSSDDALTELFREKDNSIDETIYIQQVLNSLSKDKLHLYKLYYVDKIPMKNIAERLGIPEPTLRMKYVRLRREIRSIIVKISL